MNRSAAPFEMNCGPLSDTICSGNPYAANKRRKVAIVLAVDVEVISNTSGYLECASTTTRNDVPKKGPAKSTWICHHGLGGQVHGCKVAGGGVCLYA